jgi:ankyrin repeat protein
MRKKPCIVLITIIVSHVWYAEGMIEELAEISKQARESTEQLKKETEIPRQDNAKQREMLQSHQESSPIPTPERQSKELDEIYKRLTIKKISELDKEDRITSWTGLEEEINRPTPGNRVRAVPRPGGLIFNAEKIKKLDAQISIKRINEKLREAVFQNQIDLASYCISKNADINALDEVSNSLLHIASSKGYNEMVALLLSNNAQVNVKNTKARTALHEASNAVQSLIIGQLLDKNALINELDINNKSPLDYVIKPYNREKRDESMSMDSCRALVSKGADFNRFIEPSVMSQLSADSPQDIIVCQLILGEPRVQYAPMTIMSTIVIVSLITFLVYIRSLKVSDSFSSYLTVLCHDIFWPTSDALFEAIKEKNKDRCERLIKRNPRLVNSQDSEKRTPLHAAVAQGERELCELLLNHGAVIRPEYLEHAIDKGDISIAQALKEKDRKIFSEVKEKIGNLYWDLPDWDEFFEVEKSCYMAGTTNYSVQSRDDTDILSQRSFLYLPVPACPENDQETTVQDDSESNASQDDNECNTSSFGELPIT